MEKQLSVGGSGLRSWYTELDLSAAPMTWKTMWLSIFAGVLAMILVPFFSAAMVPSDLFGADLLASERAKPAPFSAGSVRTVPEDSGLETVETVSSGVKFAHADLQTGWIPWIIQQASILIGALSLGVFLYAGINLIVRGDNEEELGKSTKMIIFGIVGIALAAFSYTIIANLLTIFSS